MKRRAVETTLGALALLLAGATPVRASSICGHVRDGVSLQPVTNAAVFLFDDADVYTGLYAGTGPLGRYCIDNVPVGTYTIQVRVDDYLTAVVRGIVVEDDATDVNVTTRPALFLDHPWPNPATHDVTFRLDAPVGVEATLEVYDVRGRLLMGWRGADPGSGRSIRWDLRDGNGAAIASGVYLVRLRAGGSEVVRRFVRSR